MEQTYVRKSRVQINEMPEFQVVIDPPSPVHEEEYRRSGDRSGKCKVDITKALTG